MKIKRKKQLNLPQLIEWAWENDIRNKTYRSSESAEIEFREGDVVRVYLIESDDTFTVTTEEEITEDTVFKRLVYIDDYDDTVAFSNFTIRELKDNRVKEFHAYIDGEFKLIWRDGKLI